MVIFLIDSQIAVLSWGFYQNGKKKNKKKTNRWKLQNFFGNIVLKGSLVREHLED